MMALTRDVMAAITQAANETGVDEGLLYQIAMLESGGNPKARNPNSSAGGLFQQIDANARQYGVEDRFDPYQSAYGAARFARDNEAFLRKKLGRQPTWGELYLAHQQGAGGALRLLQNPGMDVGAIVGGEAAALNGGKGMKAKDFVAMWAGKMGTRATGAGRVPFSPMGAGAGMASSSADNLPPNDGTPRGINLGGAAQLGTSAGAGGDGQQGGLQGGLVALLSSLGGGGETQEDDGIKTPPPPMNFGRARRGSSILERLAGGQDFGQAKARGLGR